MTRDLRFEIIGLVIWATIRLAIITAVGAVLRGVPLIAWTFWALYWMRECRNIELEP